MNKKIIIRVVLAVVVLSLVFIGIKNNQASNPASVITANQESNNTKIRVADLPVLAGLPLYVAIERGYFNEVGLDVEYMKLDSPNIIIDALISENVDITSPSGAMGISGIADFRKPGTLEIYATAGDGGDHRFSSFISSPDSGIKSFGDLGGKKMGILPGIQWRTIAKHLLKSHGLTLDQVTLIELAPGLQVRALISNQVDALVSLEPIPTIAEKHDMKILETSPTLDAIANPFYPGAGIVRSEFADENPEAVEKFITATERAVDYINNNPDEARKYLVDYTPLDEELASIVPLPLIKTYKDFTEEDIKAIEDFHQIFTTHRVIDGEIDTRGMIYKPRE